MKDLYLDNSHKNNNNKKNIETMGKTNVYN